MGPSDESSLRKRNCPGFWPKDWMTIQMLSGDYSAGASEVKN